MKAVYILAGGVLAAVVAWAASSAAEAKKPPGERARKGDDAEFDLSTVAGALVLPPGASFGVLRVTDVGPDYLTGVVTGVFLADALGGPPQLHPLPPTTMAAGIRVPKDAVTAVMRDGALI